MEMGLQTAVNIFSTLPSYTCKLVQVASEAATSCTTSQRDFMEADSGIQQLQESMDKLLEGCSSRDSIKNTMLRHEKIFKEQVLELHRLYKVQKIRMAQQEKEIRLQRVTTATSGPISDARSGFWSSTSNSQGSLSSKFLDRPKLDTQASCEFKIHQGSNNAGPSSGILNFSFVENYRAQKGLKVEGASIHGFSGTGTLANVDQFHPTMETSRSDSHKVDDSDLELTLSLGGSSSRKKSSQNAYSKSELGQSESISDRTWQPTSSSSHTRPMQEHDNLQISADSEGLQQPPWLLRSLSLKRT